VSVQATVRVGHGFVALGSGDYLQYFLIQPGIAHGAFACEHRAPIVSINGAGNHAWVLSTTGVPSPNLFLLDLGPGGYDNYVVSMVFAQAQAYTLRVVRQPASIMVQDIDFVSNSPTDIYHHPLLVERV